MSLSRERRYNLVSCELDYLASLLMTLRGCMCIVYDTRYYLQKLVGKLREILQLRHFVVVSLCLDVPIGIVKAPYLDYHDHSLQSCLLLLTGKQIAGACIFLILL